MLKSVERDFLNLSWGDWLGNELKSLEAEHAKYFAQSRDPLGTAWAKLKPATVKRKGHATILVDTGRLRASLSQPNSEYGIRYAVDEWPRAGIVFGTDAPYSHYHDEGRPPRLPQRQHIGITPPYFDAMASRAVNFAFQKLAG